MPRDPQHAFDRSGFGCGSFLASDVGLGISNPCTPSQKCKEDHGNAKIMDRMSEIVEVAILSPRLRGVIGNAEPHNRAQRSQREQAI